MTDARQAPLAGMRVIDLSTSYAGPTCTMYLAEMGADVVKIERPEGDDTRGWGPPFVDGESAWFLSANRSKRSVCLDLSRPQGRADLLKLLAEADVLVESFNPAKLRKIGIHPDDLRARFPRLIYCALSGFGLDGPDANLPGYDLIAQARSGLMSVTGAVGGPPQRVSTALSDVVAALISAFAVAAAFRHQERTGEGDLIDVSLLEADLALLSPRVTAYLAGDAEPRPSGATDSVLFPYQPFPTADRPIVVAAGNDRIWRRFVTAIDLPELLADEFATNAGRKDRREYLIAALTAQLADRPSAHWLAACRAAGVPAAPVQTLSELLLDPQVVARRMVTSVDHPGGGAAVAVLEAPWALGSLPRPVRHRRPPALGEHTADLLGATEPDGPDVDVDVDLAHEGAPT